MFKNRLLPSLSFAILWTGMGLLDVDDDRQGLHPSVPLGCEPEAESRCRITYQKTLTVWRWWRVRTHQATQQPRISILALPQSKSLDVFPILIFILFVHCKYIVAYVRFQSDVRMLNTSLARSSPQSRWPFEAALLTWNPFHRKCISRSPHCVQC